ncbi:hypothetical protein GALL_469820 [mine drainage metagenome]|uniref:Uncharacterized protein n=1 Tax=mine drainage metagenome TaxID=410659 RepID=A0A1J5PIS1_9ZZZZ
MLSADGVCVQWISRGLVTLAPASLLLRVGQRLRPANAEESTWPIPFQTWHISSARTVLTRKLRAAETLLWTLRRRLGCANPAEAAGSLPLTSLVQCLEFAVLCGMVDLICRADTTLRRRHEVYRKRCESRRKQTCGPSRSLAESIAIIVQRYCRKAPMPYGHRNDARRDPVC